MTFNLERQGHGWCWWQKLWRIAVCQWISPSAFTGRLLHKWSNVLGDNMHPSCSLKNLLSCKVFTQFVCRGFMNLGYVFFIILGKMFHEEIHLSLCTALHQGETNGEPVSSFVPRSTYRVGLRINAFFSLFSFSLSPFNGSGLHSQWRMYTWGHLSAYLVVCRLVFQSWLVQDSFNLLMVEVGDANGFCQASIHQLFHGLAERGAKSTSGTEDRSWNALLCHGSPFS